MNKRGQIITLTSIIAIAIFLSIVAVAKPSGPSGGGGGSKKCNNGIDDDNDGLIDYPTDPGCSGVNETYSLKNLGLMLISFPL